MGLILTSFLELTLRTVGEVFARVLAKGGPEITFQKSFGDLGLPEVKHSCVGESYQRFTGLGWDEDPGWLVVRSIEVEAITTSYIGKRL